MKRFSLLMLMLLTLGSSGLFGQCDYEYRKADPLTNEMEFKTKWQRLSGNSKTKGVVKIAYCKASLAKSAKGDALILEVRYTDSYKKTMMFRTAIDSLRIKFDDGTIHALPMTVLPSSVLTGAGGLSVTWTLTYRLTAELKTTLLAGRAAVFMRIDGSTFNTDIDTFENSLATIFKQCWEEGPK